LNGGTLSSWIDWDGFVSECLDFREGDYPLFISRKISFVMLFLRFSANCSGEREFRSLERARRNGDASRIAKGFPGFREEYFGPGMAGRGPEVRRKRGRIIRGNFRTRIRLIFLVFSALGTGSFEWDVPSGARWDHQEFDGGSNPLIGLLSDITTE
jgi:hypothetical protein